MKKRNDATRADKTRRPRVPRSAFRPRRWGFDAPTLDPDFWVPDPADYRDLLPRRPRFAP